jgi:hypothetical protein
MLEKTKVGRVDRHHFLGGSDARVIMGGDEKALIRLWQEKRGEVGPQDLSGDLIVQLGLVTEDLNRAWYERNNGCRSAHLLGFPACPRLANPQTFSPSVFWQEFNSRRLQCAAHLLDRGLRYFATLLLEIYDGRQSHRCRFRELRLSHVQQRSCGPTLCGSHRINNLC